MKVAVIKSKHKEYLHEIKPQQKDINNLKKSDSWKIQLALAINFYLLKALMKSV